MSEDITKWLDSHQEEFIEMSDKIWEIAEIAFQEEKSAKLILKKLEERGFETEIGIADMPTAFIGTFGEGDPKIGILGEYDALPGLSQKVKTIKDPIIKGKAGHGCGHNLLGIGSLAAVFAIKHAIESGLVKGTIRYYGCPAEETFNAKGYMVKQGYFDDIDIALTWHPGFLNMINIMSALAMNSVKFRFYGKTAHAAGDPQNGRSALDAVELMNIGANYMREHIIQEARLHYVITNGGDAPNVVPDEAEVWYFVRAPKRNQVDQIYERLKKIAKGAALMTGTEMEIDLISGTYNASYNKVVQEVIESKLKKVGAPKFDKTDKKFAKELRKTLPPDSFEGYYRLIPPEYMEMAKAVLSQPLNKIIIPPLGKGKSLPGSTDVADVSWVVPLAEFQTACQIMGSPGHSWQNVATSGMSIGHKGMIVASKVLALSAFELMNNPELIEKAKKEFEQEHKEDKYSSPLPDGLRPPIN
ncbi:MAG: Amidohydrolase [Promethearchaeota archaeon]|nr:MAG: Amidohydrolase [Candidatus Lokiarchaeota archaeon]